MLGSASASAHVAPMNDMMRIRIRSTPCCTHTQHAQPPNAHTNTYIQRDRCSCVWLRLRKHGPLLFAKALLSTAGVHANIWCRRAQLLKHTALSLADLFLSFAGTRPANVKASGQIITISLNGTEANTVTSDKQEVLCKFKFKANAHMGHAED